VGFPRTRQQKRTAALTMKLIEEARLLGTGCNTRNYMVVDFFFFLLFFEVVVFVSWLGEAKEIVLRANASPRAAIMSFFILLLLSWLGCDNLLSSPVILVTAS